MARHRSGPLLKERLAYLTHLKDRGYTPNGLRKKARSLLVTAQMLGLASQSRKILTLAGINRKMANRRCLIPLATRWLQFMGRLQQRPAPLTPCAKKIKAFADYMEHEAELSPVTIHNRCWWVRRFFEQLRVKRGFLHEITPHRIDMAFQKLLEPAGYSRKSIRACATHCGLSFVSRKHAAGAVKDWRRPFRLRGSTRRQPLTRFGIHGVVERHAAQAATKLPSLAKKRVSPHTMRHTTATHLLRSGVDINTIRAWLGHVCLSTTNVYAEVDLEMKAKALVKCEIKDGRPKEALA